MVERYKHFTGTAKTTEILIHKCCDFHSVTLAAPTAADGRLSKTASKEDCTKMNNGIWR